jgi:hypothetical protein
LYCISLFSGGTFIGFAGGEWILKMSQKGESDESGSMGVILPSYEALNGAFWGGLAGLLVYSISLKIADATVAQRNRVAGQFLLLCCMLE